MDRVPKNEQGLGQRTVTVLAEYQRLEAEGIWRSTPDAQRRDVIISIGKATLTIAAANGTALTHWSLPAVERHNPNEMPAVYGPGADAPDTLEISDPEMVQAIERVLATLQRRPTSGVWGGRLIRWGILAAVAAGLVFWLPSAITAYTASLVPEVAQAQIGRALLEETERVAGAPCSSPEGDRALTALGERLFPDGGTELVILPSTLETTAHLPGGTLLISHTLVEDFETAEVVAGYAIAEHLRGAEGNTLGVLLEASPFRASLALLSTGRLRKIDLERMAEELVVRAPAPLAEMDVIEAMDARSISTAPYGYALDISGETTGIFIENANPSEPVLGDTDWIALQQICAE